MIGVITMGRRAHKKDSTNAELILVPWKDKLLVKIGTR